MDTSVTLDRVVTDGVHFLQSITEHYGAERGMALWEALGPAMGKEVKGRVFFAILTGTHVGRVQFIVDTTPGSYHPNAVACIKAIRTATNWGLKEAKDLYDSSKNRKVVVDCETPEHSRVLANTLKDLGCRVY